MNILLVERDASLLETIRDICHEEGITAVTATDCGEARTHLQNGFKPALILCDQFLPANVGKSFQLELQKHPEWRKIPFILMLAMRPLPGKTAGADELIKPFSMEDLLELFRKVRPS